MRWIAGIAICIVILCVVIGFFCGQQSTRYDHELINWLQVQKYDVSNCDENNVLIIRVIKRR